MLADAFLTNAVANRASRVQGRAFASTCARIWPMPSLRDLEAQAKSLRGHYAPLAGAAGRALSISLDVSQRLFLFQTVRGVTAAAVRLGIVGAMRRSGCNPDAPGCSTQCGPAAVRSTSVTSRRPHRSSTFCNPHTIVSIPDCFSPEEPSCLASCVITILPITSTTIRVRAPSPSRAAPLSRDYDSRAFTVGIGGPVGSGKTALLLALCRRLRERYRLAVVTNDIFTREDAEFLVRHHALPAERIAAVETGGCPHTAVRDDVSQNLEALDRLMAAFHPELLFVESGGDNLAAQFSRDLADYTIYVIDVAGGDKIPRKGGPGITQSDLLVINKTDLAPLVGADLAVMERDARRMRGDGPFVFAQVTNDVGVETVVDYVLRGWKAATQLPLPNPTPKTS